MGLDRKVGELKKINKRSTVALLEPLKSPEPDVKVFLYTTKLNGMD